MNTISRRTALIAGTSTLIAGVRPAAAADSFASRPVRIIVPYAPGASADVLARLAGQRLSQRIGQPVIVENKPGAGTIIGTEYAAQQPPDGHTLLLTASGLPILPSSNPNFKLDINKDLTPISNLVQGYFVLASNPALPFRDLRGLIAHAKANPGRLSYGTAGLGTTPHLAGEYLKALTGTYMLCIPYKGSAPALAAVLINEVSLFIDPAFSVKPHIDAGRLVGLAQTGKVRSAALPQVPTSAEGGLPAFDVSYWIGIHAPGGMAPALARTISGHFAAIVREPDIRERLSSMGFDPVGNTSEEFGSLVRKDKDRWATLIRTAKLRFD